VEFEEEIEVVGFGFFCHIVDKAEQSRSGWEKSGKGDPATAWKSVRGVCSAGRGCVEVPGGGDGGNSLMPTASWGGHGHSIRTGDLGHEGTSLGGEVTDWPWCMSAWDREVGARRGAPFQFRTSWCPSED